MNLKDYVIEKESQLDVVSNVRAITGSADISCSFRDNSDVDYARILYSSSFRRLQGKMQLFIPKDANFYRNRLTHSLEVAQIAKTIAKKIELRNILTVQSCSLAHDIGNPPFGHAGEKFINSLSANSIYEGNAQSFRVLDHLEEKHHSYNGLDLTIRTLLGVVKYPYSFEENNKKFLYKDDFNKIQNWSKEYDLTLRTIDCEIMDLADEIAYAAHDLEDALKLKYFNIGELMFEFQKSEFKGCYDKLKEIVQEARDFATKAKTYETDGFCTSEEYSILFKKQLTSKIVDTLINDIGLISDKGEYKLGYSSYKELAHGLKKLTFNAIKRNPDVIEYELMGKNVIEGLYQVYMDSTFNRDMNLMPAEYRDIGDWERTVIDYIGGMMDSFAILQYQKYYGKAKLEKLYLKRED